MLEMCIGIFIRLAGQRIGLHHVDQCCLEFKVSISHRCGWSGKDIVVGVAEHSRIILSAIDADEVFVYGINGVHLVSQEKPLRDEDTGSHSRDKSLRNVIKVGR
jgi:hypothetical protein